MKVKFYTPELAHLHRYYLTDKRYALFLRDGKKFFGHIGSDSSTIRRLTRMFIKEWKSIPDR